MESRERKQARTREAILDAAREQVLEKGIEGVSLRAIARAVEYSPAGLYEYFPSKEAILQELALRVGVRLTRYMRSASQVARKEATSPLLAAGLAYIRFAVDETEDFRLLFQHTRSRRTSHEQEIPPDSPFALVRSLVEEAEKSKEIARPQDVKLDDITYTFWAYCHGAATLQMGHLAGYQACFEALDRLALTAMIKGMHPQ